MSTKTTLTVMMAASLLFGAACKKSDPAAAGADNSAAAPTPAAPGAAGADNGGSVASYPTQVNMGSITRQALQQFTVHQAADGNSPTIGHVSVGTWINIKASYSNWFLVEFPTGVGQLSPGWIELRGGVSDPRLNQTVTTTTTVDAGVAAIPVASVPATAVPPPAVDAGAAPVTSAATRPGTRPGIVIKPRH